MPDGLELVSLEEELDPVPAEPLLAPPGELGLEDAPPLDGLFVVSELDEEELGLEGEGLEGDEVDELELAEPDGLDGVVEPADEEDDGEVDDGLDEVPAEDPPPVLRSHAVSRLAPSAMETAIARVENLMWPPWLGYLGVEQGLGRAAHH